MYELNILYKDKFIKPAQRLEKLLFPLPHTKIDIQYNLKALYTHSTQSCPGLHCFQVWMIDSRAKENSLSSIP
jgi:hypothetical protein